MAAARDCLGVRFRHQGRTKAGLDCAGLVIYAAQRAGQLVGYTKEAYTHFPSVSEVAGDMGRVLVPIQEPEPGAVVRFSMLGSQATHMGVLTGDGTVIHASALGRKVVEQRIDDTLRRAIAAIYRLPEN